MAKQRGIVFFEGTIGGINFYYRKGVPTARIAGGGFTRKAIKKGANMVRVRENNSEFANCSKTNKFFKYSFRTLLVGYKDGTLHSRLMQLFLKIKNLDGVSERGNRQVSLGMQTLEGKRLLRNFNFTPNRVGLFPCPYQYDWHTHTFNVTGFDTQLSGFPKEASYMEVTLAVVRFDFDTNTYKNVFESPLVIDRDFSGSSFSISLSTVPAGVGVLFSMVRVAFYQTVNGKGYMLPGGDAFGLEVVGVEGI